MLDTGLSHGQSAPVLPAPQLTWASELKARNRSSVSCKAFRESPGMAKLASCSSPGPESHCITWWTVNEEETE